MATYQDSQTAEAYVKFLESNNGKIQSEVLSDAIKSRLPQNSDAAILDAGCGQGWLTEDLKKNYPKVEACDASGFLIDAAKEKYKGINFQVASLDGALPYPPHTFDAVILNMVGPDLDNLTRAFINVSSVLKPGGKLIMTIPHPGLTYPAAVWKRSLFGFLFFRKPKLKFQIPPKRGELIEREFGNTKISSHYYGLSDYVTNATSAGLKLKERIEIKSKTDSKTFDLRYQLYRYPLLLLLEFTK